MTDGPEDQALPAYLRRTEPLPVYLFAGNAVELVWMRPDGSIITREIRTCPLVVIPEKV